MPAEVLAKLCKLLLPVEAARHLRVPVRDIRAAIRRGDLRAMDLAAGRPGRRRYRISAGDLADYESRLAVGPELRSRRRRAAGGDYVKYFPE
jgi:hypothetical protein